MPRYLVQASYTSSAAAAFVSNPQNRVAGLQTLAKKLGGELEMLEFCLGEYDIVGIVVLANDTIATALSLAVGAAGHLKSYKTTRLMPSKEFLAAQKKAHGLSYKAPVKRG